MNVDHVVDVLINEVISEVMFEPGVDDTSKIRLYTLEREGYDYVDQLLHFVDRKSAVDQMINHAITTKCIALVYVYEYPECKDKSYKLVERIELKITDNPRFYMIWQRQQDLDMSLQDALSQPSLFYDCLRVVNII